MDDWPDDRRIERIGQNGPTGCHYNKEEKIDKDKCKSRDNNKKDL